MRYLKKEEAVFKSLYLYFKLFEIRMLDNRFKTIVQECFSLVRIFSTVEKTIIFAIEFLNLHLLISKRFYYTDPC